MRSSLATAKAMPRLSATLTLGTSNLRLLSERHSLSLAFEPRHSLASAEYLGLAVASSKLPNDLRKSDILKNT